MIPRQTWARLLSERPDITPVELTCLALFVAGLVLGAAVHKGFMILTAMSAFGPGVLRQFRLLDDLDEFQKEAAAQAGLRAYLVGAVFLMVVVVTQGWDQLSLTDDQVPASGIVTIMLVVYYASYCLSFWDPRKAVSRILMAFGVFWLGFVVLSHWAEPSAMLVEGLVVPGPFILFAVLCRRWPRTVGMILIGASVWSVLFFHLLPVGATDSHEGFRRVFVFALIPLPLATAGVALVTTESPNEAPSVSDA